MFISTNYVNALDTAIDAVTDTAVVVCTRGLAGVRRGPEIERTIAAGVSAEQKIERTLAAGARGG